ncbi:hypothetical protein [Pseudomonas sp. LFM046]|uniref:hypothetical protein n=1 Tax=Pseudomonas sp. LFM046 TaxID=1608357 RepID=UPI000A646561|nr:hypothetical protein [Pseudomonas sp. LFM046]
MWRVVVWAQPASLGSIVFLFHQLGALLGGWLAGLLLALGWWGWQQGGLALMQLGFNC